MTKIKDIHLRCPKCKTRFRSFIQFGTLSAFETAITQGNTTDCPSCGHVFPCNRDNMSYVLADGSGGGVGPEFGSDS